MTGRDAASAESPRRGSGLWRQVPPGQRWFLGLFAVAWGGAALVAAAVYVVAEAWDPGGLCLLAGALALLYLCLSGLAHKGLAAWGARRLRRRHPAAPWLWNPAWAAGRIFESREPLLWTWGTLAIMALFLTGLSVHVFSRSPVGFSPGMDTVAAGVAILTIADLALAVQRTVRFRRWGRACVHLPTGRGVVGGALAGEMVVPRGCERADGVVLTLSSIAEEKSFWNGSRCVRKHRSVLHVSGSDLRHGPEGTGIPFRFAVPPGASESASRRRERIWRVTWTLHAAIPGRHVKFAVPVFRDGPL